MSSSSLRWPRPTFVLIAFVTLLCLLPTSAANAADGPTRWEKAQLGLTYTVCRPSGTLGLPRTSFQLVACGSGRDSMVSSAYGRQGAGRSLTIQESQKGCLDGPDGVGPAGAFTVRGARATVLGSCATETATCPSAMSAGVRRSAYITVTLPSGGNGLGTTFVEVYSQGLSLAQITTVVRSLVPAGR